MKRLLAALLLAAAAGCSDEAPLAPRALYLRIHQDGAPLREATLESGETLQLSTSVRGFNGGVMSGHPVEWRSTAPGVASVSTGGLVTGGMGGNALVIASSGAAADTVRLTVVGPPPSTAPVACAPDHPTLALAVGQVTTVSAREADLVCLQGGAEYAYVPFLAGTAALGLQVEVAADGATAAAGPPSPSLAPSRSLGVAPLPVALRPEHDGRLHRALRDRERQLSSRIRGGGVPSPSWSLSGSARAVPREGDVLRLNVSQTACTNPDFRYGRVVAVTERAVVVADTANPANGFTDAEYRAFGVAFDTLVHPEVTSRFGVPTDIDANGRAVIFYTRAVNELTPANSSSYTGGFYFGRDLFPTTETPEFAACAGSNFAEMFYMLTADPDGVVNGNRRSKDFVAGQTVGVLAHEFQHLINASRRLRVLRTRDWVEETWLNEGLSHIAEELVFYRASTLGPRRDLTIEALRGTGGAVAAFNRYQGSNLSRYIRYLQDPDDQSVLGLDQDADDVETRGATWAFLRYAADRGRVDESRFWSTLVDSELIGMPNLTRALGTDPLPWIHDWAVAVYADNAVPGATPSYQQESWDFRSLVGALRNSSSGEAAYPVFPLKVTSLAGRGPGDPVRLSMPAAGAAFLRLGVPAGERAAVRITSAGGRPPVNLRLSILRTR